MKREIHSPKDETSFKQKNQPDWYENIIDYYIDRAMSCDGDRISIIEQQFKYLNHDIDNNKYKEVMNVLQKDLTPEKLAEFKCVKQDYNLVLRIVKKYIGEYINKYSNYQVYVEDAETVSLRNSTIASKILDISFQKFVNGLNAQGIKTGMPSQDLPTIDEIIKEETQKFIENKALEAKHRIELLKSLSDFTYKLAQLAYYYVTTDNITTYIYNDHDDTFFEVVPPNEIYCIPSSTGFIEDSPVVVRKYKMRLTEILNRFDDLLDNSKKKELQDIVYTYESSNTDFTGTFKVSDYPGILTSRFDTSNLKKI